MLFIYFQGKIKFWHCIWSIWLFWIYFLKWNRYFTACERLPNSSCHFWKHKSVFLQIFHHSSVPSSPLHIFWNFWVLGSKFVKLLMSILNWQVSFFSNFASFFSVITHNSSVTFKLMHFLLLTLPIVVVKLPNCSCHFPNNKSVFLQTLHDSVMKNNYYVLF